MKLSKEMKSMQCIGSSLNVARTYHQLERLNIWKGINLREIIVATPVRVRY
jgi:hypothetical protein